MDSVNRLEGASEAAPTQVVLTLFYEPHDQDELDNVMARFHDAGFSRVDVSESAEGIHPLTLVDAVRQLREEFPNLKRLVFVSNVRVYTVAWFRCFNHLVDDFVLFVDPQSPAWQAEATELLFNALAAFVAAEEEHLEGKLHVNLQVDNLDRVAALLLQTHFTRRLAILDQLFLQPLQPKNPVAKAYRLAADEIDCAITGDERYRQVIDLAAGQGTTGFDIRAVFNESPFVLPYVLLALLELRGMDARQKMSALDLGLQLVLKNSSDEVREHCISVLRSYTDQNRVTFPLKLAITAFRVHRLDDASAISDHFRYLKADDSCPQLHNTGLHYGMYMEEKYRLRPHREFVNDQYIVLQRLISYYRDLTAGLIHEAPKRTPGRIALVVGELRDDHTHGPSNKIIAKANAFREVFAEVDLRIFVTDRLWLQRNQETVPPFHSLRWFSSSQFADAHREKIPGVPIVYADNSLNRPQRAAALINEVNRFGPEVIWTIFEHHDPIRGMLYDDYPLLEDFTGGTHHPDDADVYMTGIREDAMRAECEYFNRPPERMQKTEARTPGYISLPKPIRTHSKAELGIPEDAFAVTLVGLTLGRDIDGVVAEALAEFLKRAPNAYLVVVGVDKIAALDERCPGDVRCRVLYQGKATDLAGLYHACDAFFSPARPGGGWGACLSLAEGVPVVVVEGDHCDIAQILGPEESLPSLDAAMEQLDALYRDPTLRKEVAARQYQRIAFMQDKHAIMQMLWDKLELAKRRFAERRPDAVALTRQVA